MNYFREFETNLAYHFSETLNYPFAKPHWIYISLSHKCTYNCQMCGVVKILKNHELPTEVVKKAFNEIAGWKSDCVITLTGGEPFLRKDIFELIKYAAQRKLVVEVVSNGSLINEGLADKIIASGLNNIAVSLDGAKASTHDYIREKGSFNKAIKALDNLAKAKKQRKKGPQISVWTTIMKENVNELFDIISIVENLSVECLVYHPVIVAQDDMQNTSDQAPFWIRGDNVVVLKEQIDKIVEYKNSHGLIAFLHDPCLWVEHFNDNLTKKDWKCNPFVFINIGPDGEMRSCGVSFGNIKNMSLEECLNTKEAFQARNLMKNCQKPCLQTCWAHPESDSLKSIADTFISGSGNDRNKAGSFKKASNLLSSYQKILEDYA
ncbi:radical SAM protein [bacterium]|nr:radical SAM protein [bacterium]